MIRSTRSMPVAVEPPAPTATKRPSNELPPLLLRPKEAARLLRICTKMLSEMTAPRGPIPAIKISRTCVRYSYSALQNSVAAIEQWAIDREKSRQTEKRGST